MGALLGVAGTVGATAWQDWRLAQAREQERLEAQRVAAKTAAEERRVDQLDQYLEAAAAFVVQSNTLVDALAVLPISGRRTTNWSEIPEAIQVNTSQARLVAIRARLGSAPAPVADFLTVANDTIRKVRQDTSRAAEQLSRLEEAMDSLLQYYLLSSPALAPYSQPPPS